MKDFKEIKTKKPWGRIVPSIEYSLRAPIALKDMPTMPDVPPLYRMVTQADFLREFYPSGHLINSEEYYPNIYREEEVAVIDENGNETGATTKNRFMEPVPRYAFAFQRIITIKHLIHLCGNDVQWDMTKKTLTKQEEDDVYEFKSGWLKKHMEIAFYEAMKSQKITGDCAIVGYINNGKFGWRSLSYFEKGDVLYPHYGFDGKLEVFARSFSSYDENGVECIAWLEVWDNEKMYRYRQDKTNENSVVHKIKELFGLDGYVLVSEERHGFNFVPVAYYRNEGGACWSESQDTIEGYELAYSEMAQNNHIFGTPIMYMQGEDVEAAHDMNGTIRILSMGKEDKAGYLEAQSAADSYMKQLEIAYKLIYRQSHAVETPQISGNSDISGAAIKILYADATEQATIDAQEVQPFVDDLFQIFAFGYGIEMGKIIEYTSIPLTPWIKPFVHVNESAIISDLATSVGSGFISKQTASERASFYADANEWDRIIKESKAQQEADLLYTIDNNQNNNGEDKSN